MSFFLLEVPCNEMPHLPVKAIIAIQIHHAKDYLGTIEQTYVFYCQQIHLVPMLWTVGDILHCDVLVLHELLEKPRKRMEKICAMKWPHLPIDCATILSLRF